MNFTAHNIRLRTGETTMDNGQTLIKDSAMWKSIEKTVDLFLPQARNGGMSAVDLGCLEGGFAVELARMGFDTLGIEARTDNIKKCNLVKDDLQLSNLEFATDDVRNLPSYGNFDVTLCYGLLYHLNDPVSFLRTLYNCTSRMLIINTHFAPDADWRYDMGFLNRYVIAPIQKRTHLFERQTNYRLSGIVEHEGYKGRWMREWNKKAPKRKVEKMLWAAYNNPKSFWLRKKDLTQALHDVGFDSVFEQFDFTGDLAPHHYTAKHNRTMFVALKHDVQPKPLGKRQQVKEMIGVSSLQLT